MGRERNESGRYNDRIEPDTVLELFDQRDDQAEPLTASDVVDEMDIARRTAHNKLNALTERGVLETKKVGARGRVWWTPILESSQEGHSTPVERSEPEPRDSHEPTQETQENANMDREIDLGNIDVPGSGAKAEKRREAIGASLEFIKENGEATPSDLREHIYPEHTGEYTTGKDPARSWWKNCVYKGLSQIAERNDRLEKADTTGVWTWGE